MNSPSQISSHPSNEADSILKFFDRDPTQALGFVERQLNALHTRAQIIIGFAAVAVTTTGFSGRLIAGTNTLAQISIISGLAIILASCLWIFLRVLSIDWIISRYLSSDFGQSLYRMIDYRNRKTRAYRIGSAGILLGLSIYGLAIAIMLLNPEPLTIPTR